MNFDGTVMKNGNSTVMIIPKTICDNYGIKKGDKLEIQATDSGLFIPMKMKKNAKKGVT